MPSLSAASLYTAMQAGQANGQAGVHGAGLVEAVAALNYASNGSTEALARALVASTKANLEAVLIALPRDGKVMVALAGQKLEVPLPADVQEQLAQNPALLRPGQHIPVRLDPEGQALRFLWLEGATNQPRSPATMVTLSTPAPSAPAPPAPPRGAALGNVPVAVSSTPSPIAVPAAVFPPGSAGYAVMRLTGLSFPLAEAGDALPAPAAASPVPRPLGAGGYAAAPLSPAPHATPVGQISPAALAALPGGMAQEVLRAAVRQGAIGSTITSLLASPAAQDLPEAALIAQLAALRFDPKTKPDGARLRDAIRTSGLFMEADLAALTPEESAAGGVPRDLKSILLTLKARLAGEGAAPAAASQAEAGVEPVPPLPRMIEGALERIKLMQLASLPDPAGGAASGDEATPLRQALAIPLALDGADKPSTAMIGLVVEHHPQGQAMLEAAEQDKPGAETHRFPWKIRLALDTAETGAVQAEIGLRGHAIAITLWAENRRMAEGARADIASLHTALREAAFEQISLNVRDGRPATRVKPTFTHLDQRT